MLFAQLAQHRKLHLKFLGQLRFFWLLLKVKQRLPTWSVSSLTIVTLDAYQNF